MFSPWLIVPSKELRRLALPMDRQARARPTRWWATQMAVTLACTFSQPMIFATNFATTPSYRFTFPSTRSIAASYLTCLTIESSFTAERTISRRSTLLDCQRCKSAVLKISCKSLGPDCSQELLESLEPTRTRLALMLYCKCSSRECKTRSLMEKWASLI